MPKAMRRWVGKETTLTMKGQTYHGKVVRGRFVNERDYGRRIYGEQNTGHDIGYAFETPDGEKIRLFVHGWPRVIPRNGNLMVVEDPYSIPNKM